MQRFAIDLDLAQAIANYLIQRPYLEVAALVRGIENLAPVPIPAPAAEATPAAAPAPAAETACDTAA